MSMTSPLEDVVAKGRQLYYESRPFGHWSEIMLQKYGASVSPYLEDAWRLLEDEAKSRPCKAPEWIIAHGRRAYEEEITFEQWSERMLINNGECVAPHLREVWTRISGRSENRLANLVQKTGGRVVLIRKAIIGTAAVAFVMAGLFPPWVHSLDVGGKRAHLNAGYSFIFVPPAPVMQQEWQGLYAPNEVRYFSVQLDSSRLAIEWACILAASGAAWFLCGTSKPVKSRDKATA